MRITMNEKSEDSFARQKKAIEEKKTSYQCHFNRVTTMTWEDIHEDFVNNHPNKYFEKVKQLNVPFKVKLELMGKFFHQQKELIQGQQHCSSISLKIGPPLHIGTIGTIALNKGNTTNDSPNSQTFEVTRSGRITKRPLYYQDDVSNKFDDLKIKTTKNLIDKKEGSEKSSEPEKEPNKAVRSVLSKYEQNLNATFDTLLTDDNRSNVNNLEDTLNESCNSPKSNIKRKHTDSQEIANNNDLDDFESKTSTAKKHKGNRFFKSKNLDNVTTQSENIIDSDNSDSENTTLVEMSLDTSKSQTQIDPIKLGRVSPPVFTKIKKKNLRKTNLKSPEIVCPICNEYFPKKDINEHASGCIKFK